MVPISPVQPGDARGGRRRSSVGRRGLRRSVGEMGFTGVDKQAILEEQLEQSRLLRKKNDEVASVMEKHKSNKLRSALLLLKKDLAMLNEIMTHFAWEEDVMTSKVSIINKAKTAASSAVSHPPVGEKRLKLNEMGKKEAAKRRRSRWDSSMKQQIEVEEEEEDAVEVAIPKRMTMSEALAKVNSVQEWAERDKEEKVVQRKTVAELQGLGEDAIVVDRLVAAIDKRREIASQISSRVLRNLKYSNFPLETIANTTARHGRLTSGEDEADEGIQGTIRTSLPLRNRASSAQGRYSVPTMQQCSQEVKNLIKLMRMYEGLMKGMYHTRAMNEGLWTESMSKTLEDEPAKLTHKLEWYEKKRDDMSQVFEQMLRNDTRENKGLHDFKTLESREAVLEHKLKEYENKKGSCARIESSVGHLKDTVSMLSGALHQSLKFFDNEISWLSPRISEADKIAATLRETVACVQSSTASLTELFQMKGKELVELQQQSTNEDADRELLALEKQMWARKMRDLEKRMEKNTRMSKVAASACVMTKQETKEMMEEVEMTSKEVEGLNMKLDEEQRNVEGLYTELQELIRVLDDEANDCHERERDIRSLKSQVNIKKVELESLTAKLMKKGGGMDMRQDIESDLRRMNRRLVEKERDAKLMESELQHLEQKVFELELVKMEEKLERMAMGEDDGDSDEEGGSSSSSSSSEGEGEDGEGGGFESDVSEARQDATERGGEHMEEQEEREREDEERRNLVRMDITRDIEKIEDGEVEVGED